jgi:hypothetical protein
VTVEYVRIRESDAYRTRSADLSAGASDFDLVTFDRWGKPTCRIHGAMNKVSPSPPGTWRCLGGLARCPAGCQEARVPVRVPGYRRRRFSRDEAKRPIGFLLAPMMYISGDSVYPTGVNSSTLDFYHRARDLMAGAKA